jgi:hypothetical protein
MARQHPLFPLLYHWGFFFGSFGTSLAGVVVLFFDMIREDGYILLLYE